MRVHSGLGGGQLSSFRRAKAPSWLLAVSLPIRGQDLPSMCVVQCFEATLAPGVREYQSFL